MYKVAPIFSTLTAAQRIINKRYHLREKAYLHVYQLYTLSRTNAVESLNIFSKGKKIFKEQDEFFFYCGEIYRLNSNTDEALYEYSKAIELAKNNGEEFYLVPFYYLNRGNLHLSLKKLESAIIDYNDLLRLNPVSTAGFTNRGIAYHMLGEIDKACRDWESAIQLGFQQPNTYHEKYCR